MKKILAVMILPVLMMGKMVTFKEALELTLKNNKQLKAKEYESKKSIQDLKMAQGYKKGKVEFSEQISRTNNAGYVFGMKLASREATFGDFGFDEFINQMDTITPSSPTFDGGSKLLATQPDNLNYPGVRNNFETKITFEMPLYTGGKLESAESMANLQIKANQAKLSHDKKQIGLEVLRAYNGAVAAKKFIKMTKNAKIITTRFKKKAKQLYKRRLVRIIDVKQSKMAAFSVNAKIEEAENKFNLAIAYLQFLTDDSTLTDVNDFVLFNFDNIEIDNLQKNAISLRDDYKWMKLNTKTMKQKIKFESADEEPMVGTHFEYGLNDNTIDIGELPHKDYYLAAVGLKYSIFDGDIVKAKKQKSKIEYLKTKNYFEYMKKGINLEVKKNYLDLKTQTSTLKQKIKTESMAQDILKETEKMFANNLQFRTNMMYLLMQLENMLKAQADVIMSQYNQTITSGKLKLSLGEGLNNG
jgi:outer membrane protein TolC